MNEQLTLVIEMKLIINYY